MIIIKNGIELMFAEQKILLHSMVLLETKGNAYDTATRKKKCINRMHSTECIQQPSKCVLCLSNRSKRSECWKYSKKKIVEIYLF